MKKSLLACTLVFLYFIPVAKAQVKLTPELLWQFSRVSEPRISPDGNNVVYSQKSYDLAADKGNNDLFIISTEGGDARVIASGPENDHSATWSPDGKKILFLSNRSGSTQLWQMNPDGNNKSQVSDEKGDLEAYGIAPSGNKVWFSMAVKTGKTTQEIYPELPKANARIYDDLMYRHWDHWEDEKHNHIFYASLNAGKLSGSTDIMTGEPFDSPLSPFGGPEQVAFSHDGNRIAYTCKKLSGKDYATTTNSDIYLYDLATGKTENISKGMEGYDMSPVFSPDGKRLIWLSMKTPVYEADRNRIMEMNPDTKSIRELTADFPYSADKLSFSKDGKQIYFMAGVNATDQVWVLSEPSKKPITIRQLTTDTADHIDYSFVENGKKKVMVTAMMSISKPVELYKIDMETGYTRQITSANNALLGKIKMGKVEKRMIKATDGKEILTWVIYPPDFDATKKYPALLYCQGGPQSTISQFFSYRWNFQLMAANGYIVVAPNRRGLPSFGEEWNRQISGDWGGQAMKDLLSAIDNVSSEPFVDKNKLGAVGASFGGYSVYWLAGNHNKRFKAFIAHDGVFNLESMYGMTEEIWFPDFDMGGPYWKEPEPKSYKLFSPHRFVKNWDTPILVIHNDKDFRVPLAQGMEAFTAARLMNVPARFLSFPEENHWMLKPQNSVLWQKEFFSWLDKWLK